MTSFKNIPDYIQQTLVLDSKTWFATYSIGDYEQLKELMLKKVTDRMHEIEKINMVYNKTTDFGTIPNGQEIEIEILLVEWDTLNSIRTKAKTKVSV